MDIVRSRVGFSNGFYVDCMNRRGGLALLWKAEVDLSIKSFSEGHIDSVVKQEEGGLIWRFTGFYGNPVAN